MEEYRRGLAAAAAQNKLFPVRGRDLLLSLYWLENQTGEFWYPGPNLGLQVNGVHCTGPLFSTGLCLVSDMIVLAVVCLFRGKDQQT